MLAIAPVSRRSMALLPQVLPRRLIRRTGSGYQLPECRRMIHPLQVHQLVNEHVIADPVRHLQEPPVQADVPARRTRSPTPALIPDADARHRDAVTRRQLQQPRRELAPRPRAQLARFARPAFPRWIPAPSTTTRASCLSIHARSRSAKAFASRLEPQRGIVTRTVPSGRTRIRYRRARECRTKSGSIIRQPARAQSGATDRRRQQGRRR